jgi:hypothetical protein
MARRGALVPVPGRAVGTAVETAVETRALPGDDIAVLPWWRAHLALIVLAVVGAVALVHLPFPFSSDQAYSTQVADALRHGDVLYRDVWDVRQPGIFLFFLAGSVLRRGEVGVHIVEAVWMLAFAVVLQRRLRGRFAHGWLAPCVPLFTVVAYWAAATRSELTQVEALVGFPLFVACTGLADIRDRAPSRASLWMTGLAAAGVAYIKLLYLPIVVAVWAIAALDLRRADDRRPVARTVVPVLGGFLLPLGAGAVYAIANGIVGDVYWTFVEFPPKQRALDLRDAHRLRLALRYVWVYFGWALPLVALALARFPRDRRHPPRLDRVALALTVWLVVGTGLLLGQTWGPYQFQLLVVPLGVLAAFGVDRLLLLHRDTRSPASTTARRVAWWTAALAIAVLALVPLRPLVAKTLSFVRDDATLTASGRRAFEEKYAPYYPVARRSVAFLRAPGAVAGPIHVMGQAELQYFSGRAMAGPVSGQTVEQLDGKLWRTTRDELHVARYLFLSDFYRDLTRQRSPVTARQIERDFCRLDRAADGWWYANRAFGGCDRE